MDIIESIKYLRTKKKIKQKDMLKSKKNYQTYNRIETNQQKLSLPEFIEISESLDMKLEEILSYSDYSLLKSIDQHFFKCAQKKYIEDKDYSTLIEYYNYLESIESKNSGELSLYYDIKIVFPELNEIDEISKLDLHIIYKHIMKKEYYTYFDYRLVANTIILFPEHKAEKLVSRMFPLIDRTVRNDKTLLVSSNLILNFVSNLINQGSFEKVNKYIPMARELNIDSTNYFFHFTLYYYENLTLHMLTKKLTYLNKVYEYILFIEKIGDKEFSKKLETEVQNLIYDHKKIDAKKTEKIVRREF